MKQNFLIIFFLSILCVNCHKKCPEPGNYNAVFNGTYEVFGGISSESFTTVITETKKDYFKMGDFKVYKCKDEVKGKIPGGGGYVFIEIEGVCSKKKGKYTFKGTYNATDTIARKVLGEFLINSI